MEYRFCGTYDDGKNHTSTRKIKSADAGSVDFNERVNLTELKAGELLNLYDFCTLSYIIYIYIYALIISVAYWMT
jgi:hypothetical protein